MPPHAFADTELMRAPPRWAGFAPALGRVWRERLVALACQLGSAEEGVERQTRIRDAHAAFRTASSRQPHLAAQAAAQVLVDLAQQGWGIRVRGQSIEVRAPDSARGPAEKERIRAQELMKRDEQLAKPTVRAFIERMEHPRSYAGQEVSIKSLMRDGRDLVCALSATRDEDDPVAAAATVIQPYLQFVGANDRCAQTGLRLADIWRYFRLTWANQATNTPGRTMRFLVRDEGAQYHPVMGIGALGSPVAQLRDRDAWIGWDADGFLRRLRALGAPAALAWAMRALETALAEIHVDDLVEDGILSDATLQSLAPETESALLREADRQSRIHRESVQRGERARPANTSDRTAYWREHACTPLFRSKRCRELASLLQAKRALRLDGEAPDPFTAPSIQRALRHLIRREKARRMGTAMADLAVCGAIPPYNPLATGKLIAVLAISPKVVAAYRERYRDAESEIASAMAGRPVVRSSELALVTTSSLYGVPSSQYNRIAVPSAVLGGEGGEPLRYLRIGTSDAYGTSQFSQTAVELLETLARSAANPPMTGNIFGEGASPKMRNLRQGLDALGAPADLLLQHGRTRYLYVAPLARNTREVLRGFEEHPAYFAGPDHDDSDERIARWWLERWALKRLSNLKVPREIARHSPDGPEGHGARVRLPPEE